MSLGSGDLAGPRRPPRGACMPTGEAEPVHNSRSRCRGDDLSRSRSVKLPTANQL